MRNILKLKTKAFTLVELIITITILAILATIAFINLGNYPADSRDSVRKSDLRTIEKAMTIYHIENGRYPTPDKDPVDGKTYFGEKAFKEIGKINKLPLDPTTGKPYRYISLGVGYILVAELENGELFRVDNSRLAFQTCGMDYGSIKSKYGGEFNSGFSYNLKAFTAMKADGTLYSWGNSGFGGDINKTPKGKGFIKVFPTSTGFFAINPYGKITYWGGRNLNLTEEEGFIKIYSSPNGFTAMKVDGSLKTFKLSSIMTNAPDGEFKEVFSNLYAFSGITKNGEIKTWGDTNYGGTGGPSGNGWIKIYSSQTSFTALNQDGTLYSWGNNRYNPPIGKSFKKIISFHSNFVGIDTDGHIYIWGNMNSIPGLKSNGWIDLYPLSTSFLGVNQDGNYYIGTTSNNILKKLIPKNYKKIFGVYSDNRVIIIDDKGKMYHDYFQVPNTTGWKYIATSYSGFAAINNDGSIYYKTTNNSHIDAPQGKFVKIFSNTGAFVAMDDKGCLKSWGDTDSGGRGAPPDCGRIEVNGSRVDDLEDCSSI